MNRKYLVFSALAVCVILAGACREEEAPPTTSTSEMAGTTNPTDVSPMAAQTWLDDVTIGKTVGADGAIPAGQTGDDFAPGQPVVIAIETADAPAGSAVKVIWYGPGEIVIAEEQKDVVAGAKYLNFTAASTRSWAKGDYRAEVWVGDEKVNTQQFQIVDAAKAGK